ncbi:peptidyl-prolyl cis-trans isomerase PASTICCINO1 [Striga asiatica]|uniref:peptidylprolyl isomerase n=1 Tax=Striga asiatica TaxID=4170 RepID=A0A5A7Q797_STRAF|nr:peptidyl-prolyl cis-trans isomerase PASTICCINO1 [Striga asiatica]
MAVVYHCTVRTLDGVVVESTRADFGGKGIPKRQVLGKSKMLLGLLEGIPTMLSGEVAMFRVKPELHYGEEDCPVAVADGFPKDDELHFEIELIDFSKVKIPKGLEMGIGTMSRGEKAVIYVTKDYLTQSPLIPSIDDIAEIHFEVDLVHFVQVRDVLGDGRLIKRRLRDGRGDFPMDCPLQDSLLHVHYKAMLLNEEKTVFYDTKINNNGQPFEFRSGEGLVPEGFEMCTRLMLPGEIALVTCPPDYAYDKFSRPAEVPQGAYIQWEIELLDYEKQKDWNGFNFREIMEDVEKIKGTGNRLFKEGKYELAKAKYEHVLREFNHVNPQDDDEGKEFSDTRNLLNLNMAACWLKLGEFRKSIEACNKLFTAEEWHTWLLEILKKLEQISIRRFTNELVNNLRDCSTRNLERFLRSVALIWCNRVQVNPMKPITVIRRMVKMSIFLRPLLLQHGRTCGQDCGLVALDFFRPSDWTGVRYCDCCWIRDPVKTG